MAWKQSKTRQKSSRFDVEHVQSRAPVYLRICVQLIELGNPVWLMFIGSRFPRKNFDCVAVGLHELESLRSPPCEHDNHLVLLQFKFRELWRFHSEIAFRNSPMQTGGPRKLPKRPLNRRNFTQKPRIPPSWFMIGKIITETGMRK